MKFKFWKRRGSNHVYVHEYVGKKISYTPVDLSAPKEQLTTKMLVEVNLYDLWTKPEETREQIVEMVVGATSTCQDTALSGARSVAYGAITAKTSPMNHPLSQHSYELAKQYADSWPSGSEA